MLQYKPVLPYNIEFNPTEGENAYITLNYQRRSSTGDVKILQTKREIYKYQCQCVAELF